MRASTAVRSKLLRATVGTWIMVTLLMLGAAAVSQVRATNASTRRIEAHFREHQREKGHLLVSNQVLALRPMAADNAFLDVRRLVRQTVHEDPDIIYGAFLDPAGAAWIVVTPRSIHPSSVQEEAAFDIRELPPIERTTPSRVPAVRNLFAFGTRIQEHSADVWDGSDYLGNIRYGFSMARTDAAVRQSYLEGRQTQFQLLGILTALGVAGIALGVWGIRRLATRITQPLAELTRASEELGQGNRAVRAQVRSGDELEQLALTFNAMAEANERAMHELEIRTAEALESSRLKSEFLANMSHEIRTPMNGILGVVRIVNKMPLEGKLRRYMETIDASASALLTIINDVLDFSKMEAGKYAVRRVSMDFRAVVQDACDLLANRAHDKGLELICRVDPQLRSTHFGDPDRLRQIINNLLGNAIKFTDSGEVFINISSLSRAERSERLRVSVADTGIGIATNDIGKLFDAFSQVDGSTVRRHGGTGLGLAISKRLVELMGGSIGVTSTLGKGSEFYFEIDLEMDSDATSDRGTWANGKHVAVLESNPRWAAVISEHLEAWGMVVTVFANGSEFVGSIERARESDIDAAIISTGISDVQFDECVRRVHASFSALPIIALYRLGGGPLVTEIEKELAAQVPKPLRLSELYNTLQLALGFQRVTNHGTTATDGAPLDVSGRVLVVDDNEINRFVAAEMLEQMGYLVEVAENGAEAVDLVKQGDYLVVLMDCQMPVMDGYTATREIRNFEARLGRHQPIIALTAHALPGERGRVLEAGMDDYLSKPVRPNSLDKMIHRFARLRSKAQQETPTAANSQQHDLLDGSIWRSARLIELFLKNLPGQLGAIEAAAQCGNAQDLRAHAHKAKGSCLALGAVGMAETAERVQKVAEAGQLESTRELVQQLRTQYDQTALLLQRELGREGLQKAD